MCNKVCHTVTENVLTMNCSLIFKQKRQCSVHLFFFFLFFWLTIKDKTNISLTLKILHLRQGSFTRKVRTIFTLKIIVSIFVKLLMILVLHLRQFFIVSIFVKRATGTACHLNLAWRMLTLWINDWKVWQVCIVIINYLFLIVCFRWYF